MKRWLLLFLVNGTALALVGGMWATGRIASSIAILVLIISLAFLNGIVLVASRKHENEPAHSGNRYSKKNRLPVLYWIAIVFSVAYALYMGLTWLRE